MEDLMVNGHEIVFFSPSDLSLGFIYKSDGISLGLSVCDFLLDSIKETGK